MSIVRPVWLDYIEWDYSDPSFPVMKGLKKGTPEEIVRQFEEDQKMCREAEEMGILL